MVIMRSARSADQRTRWRFIGVVVLLVGFVPFSLEQDEDIPHNEVKNWALKFGVDLWEFGRQFTKMSEIQRKYHEMDVRITRKDGLILIREMAAEVKNMMDIKMSAVLRIMDSAENAALSHKFDETLLAKYINSRSIGLYGLDGRPFDGSRVVTLTPNRHFDHLPVNTNYSSLLFPTNVDETDTAVQNGIQWSQKLDLLFINNYEVDPSLSWQYFGSSTGFLRRYPAIKWPPVDGMPSRANVYDFRSSAWYMDSATSSKDIVILVDISATMKSRHLDISRAITNAILDTLGNNDFVNVFRFSNTVEEVTPCFHDMLVQATAPNIRELRLGLDHLEASGSANFTAGLITAFELLHRYNRSGLGCQCNQAIMLITNGPPSNFEDVFNKYNWPHRPVRVFTYMTGRDGSNAADMSWMACNNKGFFSIVDSPSDAPNAVMHYVEVLARPMVMYQHDHPVRWTPVYPGGQANTMPGSSRPQDQLMTSVSTPIFDRRNYSERSAKLLGVVGTDVPIHHIKKLVPQYRLGVNGYSFIVDNNGHLLYHPDLRPLFQETLRPFYSSVDLSEVELVDTDNGPPLENNTALLELRHEMIDQKEGETELNVILHYDQMKRVMHRRHRYFYNAIDGTPFSLGIALPEGYGMYEVHGAHEIKHSHTNVLEYFKGSNWKIHPDWVYCEYNYASEHWFDSAEEQLLHFLERSHKPGWKWMSLRPRSPVKENGNMKKMEKDSYYCDKELVQSLVYDAIVTLNFDRHSPANIKDQNHQGYQMFGVTTTFIATRSGLLRWHDHTSPDPKIPHFSEKNRRAVDEIWYQRAVHQHTIEPESFVFSVPFDAADQEKPLVTATHAVFVEHKGHRAPAAVVGLQFQYETLASHFKNITSACTGGMECKRHCASPELHCYVLDNNGFVIMSEVSVHTGKFFGQIDGTIMDSLVQDRIYKRVLVHDYQGACFDDKSYYYGRAALHSPFQLVQTLLKTLAHIFLTLTTLTQAHLWSVPFAADDDEVDYDDYDGSPNLDSISGGPPPRPSPPQFGNDSPSRFPSHTHAPPATKYMPGNGSVPRPCTKSVWLYNLQPDRLNASGMWNPLKGKLTNCHASGCERPFSVQKIPYSNLILLVVDTLCPCGTKQLTVTPQENGHLIQEEINSGCRRKPQDSMYRRRPEKCINYHPEETEIKVCGRGYSASLSGLVFFSSLALGLTKAFAT